jgi:hypothetical protein
MLKLAERSPVAGAKVWHAGYGIDRPENREEGLRGNSTTASGKLEFILSVSSGDSGGPIIDARTEEIVSCVCCTQARGKLAPMYGASVESIRALLAKVTVAEEWTPLQIPEIDGRAP